MTPPKTILDKNLTLIEANCVPSALMHFGCDEKLEKILKDEYYEKLSSGFGASSALLSNQAKSQSVVNEPKAAHSAPKNFMESKSCSNKPTGTVPKWFKSSK